MPLRVEVRRRAVAVRLPSALVEAWGVRALELGVSKTAFVERLLEAALGVGESDKQGDVRGAVVARAPAPQGPALPRVPVDRAAAFRAAAAKRSAR